MPLHSTVYTISISILLYIFICIGFIAGIISVEFTKFARQDFAFFQFESCLNSNHMVDVVLHNIAKRLREIARKRNILRCVCSQYQNRYEI